MLNTKMSSQKTNNFTFNLRAATRNRRSQRICIQGNVYVAKDVVLHFFHNIQIVNSHQNISESLEVT